MDKIVCPVCDSTHNPRMVVGNMGMGRTCAKRYANFRIAKQMLINKKFKQMKENS